MTVNEMLDEIFEDLKVEINADDSQSDKVNEPLLRKKVEGAFRDVKRARNYPGYYTEAQIDSDMYKYYSNIEDVARYDYNKVGAEGQSSYSADGTRIDYIDRNSLFYGVYPISR